MSERRRFALPGTEKKRPTQETSTSSSHTNQSAEPTTAVPSRLKSKSRANSNTPSDRTTSTQPSRANSAHPSRKSAQVHVEPTIIERPKTPETIEEPIHFGSPASIGTHDPGFDDLRTASSPAPSAAEDHEAWEIDDTLLPQERVEIGRQKSEYERTRAYNIIRNKKSVAAIDLQVAISSLFKPDQM